MRKIIAAGLAAHTALLHVAQPLIVPPPPFRAADHGWLDLSIIKEARAEIPRPLRYIGVLCGDYELDQYLDGKLWCGQPRPGDMVELVGEFVTNRALTMTGGTQAAPYIFKSLNPPSETSQVNPPAKINGQWQVGGSGGGSNWVPNGKWIYVWGMSFCKKASQAAATPGNRGQLLIGGDDNVIRRCEFKEWSTQICVVVMGGNRGLIDYCTWHDPMGWTGTKGANPRPFDAVTNPGGSTGEYGGLAIGITDPAKYRNPPPLRMGLRTNPNAGAPTGPTTWPGWNFGFRVERCHGHNMPDKPWPGDYGSGQSDWMEIGHDGPTIAAPTLTASRTNGIVTAILTSFQSNWQMKYLLCENHAEAGAAIIDFKAPNIACQYVTMVNCPGRLDFRWGPFSSARDIHCVNSTGMDIEGWGHVIERFKNGGGTRAARITLNNGNVDPGAWTGPNVPTGQAHQNSQAVTLSQIKAAINFGDGNFDLDVRDCRVNGATPNPTTANNNNRTGCSWDGNAAVEDPDVIVDSTMAGITATWAG